jgi:hypothetical protein
MKKNTNFYSIEEYAKKENVSIEEAVSIAISNGYLSKKPINIPTYDDLGRRVFSSEEKSLDLDRYH